MTNPGVKETTFVGVDVVIPVYRERRETIQATLEALLAQAHPISKIYMIDDHSPVPVTLPPGVQEDSRVCLIRLEKNSGISGARNCGIAKSTAPFLACVNCEVLPAKNWVSSCANYLVMHPQAGVAYTRIIPHRPDRLLTRWRMRFQETRFPDVSGPVAAAPGHALMFRREAIERVEGFKLGMRCDEDADICFRIRDAGWQTHFVSDSECVSIQDDTLPRLAQKDLTRSNWESPADYAFSRFLWIRIKMTLVRIARNLVKVRLNFLPVDLAVFASSVRMARARCTKERKKKH